MTNHVSRQDKCLSTPSLLQSQIWLWVKFLHPTRHKKCYFGDVLPSQSRCAVLKKLNLTQQKQTLIKNTKILQHKLIPGLVVLYNLRYGNRAGPIPQLLGAYMGQYHPTYPRQIPSPNPVSASATATTTKQTMTIGPIPDSDTHCRYRESRVEREALLLIMKHIMLTHKCKALALHVFVTLYKHVLLFSISQKIWHKWYEAVLSVNRHQWIRSAPAIPVSSISIHDYFPYSWFSVLKQR